MASDSGRFSQEDTSLVAGFSPFASNAFKATAPPTSQYISLAGFGARFTSQQLVESRAPLPFQSSFQAPLWCPSGNAQVDELRAYRMLLNERLKVVIAQLSQLEHMAGLDGGGIFTRGSRALSKSSIDSDVFSNCTSARDLELLDEKDVATRIEQLRHAREALRERLAAPAEETAMAQRSQVAEQLSQLERELYSLTCRLQSGVPLAGAGGELQQQQQAKQLAQSRFVSALRDERELLLQQIDSLAVAESRVSSMQQQLYLRYDYLCLAGRSSASPVQLTVLVH